MQGKQIDRKRQKDGRTNVSRAGTDGLMDENERGMSGKWQV